MSLRVLTHGGAGGGESASIFVTGLSESDTVYAEHKVPKKVPNPEYVLPDGYTQLEYIESSGTQYIDTGLKGSSGYIVDIKWMCTSSANSDQTIVGSAYPIYLGINFNSSYKSFYLNYAGSSWIDIKNVAAVNQMYNLTVGMLNGNQYVIRDGATIYSGTTTGNVSNNYNITILARNTNGTIANYAYAKIYSLAFKNSDGIYVRNYIPSKRNSDNAVGLYDLINDVFYTNAGSGTFAAGEEVTQYIETLVADGKTVQGAWKEIPNPAAILPVGYTQLEYIESTGTQYIDTGFTPNQDTSLTMTAMLLSTADGASVYGSGVNNQNSAFECYLWSNSLEFNYGNNPYAFVGTAVANKKFTLEHRKVSASYEYENGASYSHTFNSTTFTSPYPLLIFANKRPTQIGYGYIRMYECSLYDNNMLIRNFIPARRNSDNVLGMYDLVNDVFYTNAGTGEFIAGAEIPQYFSRHEITKIKDYGMWAVTATDGEETAEQEVLVDAAVEYEIEIGYAVNYTMLYDFGDECEDVTGGWGLQYGHGSNYSLVKNENSIYMASSAKDNIPYVATVNKINLKEYSGICTYSDMYGKGGNSGYSAFGIDSTVKNSSNVFTSLDICVLGVPSNENANGLFLRKVGFTTSLAGYCYIYGNVPSQGSWAQTVYAVFLVKPDEIATLCSKAGLSTPSDLATLIADTTNIASILANETAVKFMVSKCTGDFMVSFIESSACLSALDASPNKDIVLGNKHWAKFLNMVGVTA